MGEDNILFHVQRWRFWVNHLKLLFWNGGCSIAVKYIFPSTKPLTFGFIPELELLPHVRSFLYFKSNPCNNCLPEANYYSLCEFNIFQFIHPGQIKTSLSLFNFLWLLITCTKMKVNLRVNSFITALFYVTINGI